MKCNVGKTDKIIRFILALVGLILGFTVNPWYFLITVVGAATAGMSFCPLYKVLGINTCQVKESDNSQAEAESAGAGGENQPETGEDAADFAGSADDASQGSSESSEEEIK